MAGNNRKLEGEGMREGGRGGRGRGEREEGGRKKEVRKGRGCV